MVKLLKVLVGGHDRCGKSSFILHFVHHSFQMHNRGIIYNQIIRIQVDRTPAAVHFVETSGYIPRVQNDQPLPSAVAVFHLFDTNNATLREVTEWHAELRRLNATAPMFLVAAKCDLTPCPEFDAILEWAKQERLPVEMFSAWNGDDLTPLLLNTLRTVADDFDPDPSAMENARAAMERQRQLGQKAKCCVV